jgi:hypothetical protein
VRRGGLEFVFVGFAIGLRLHGSLFRLIGAKAAIIGTFVAHASHPAFNPKLE